MKIITKGSPPESKVYRTECRNCGTVFEFFRTDARLFRGPMAVNYLSVACPIDECAEEAVVPV